MATTEAAPEAEQEVVFAHTRRRRTAARETAKDPTRTGHRTGGERYYTRDSVCFYKPTSCTVYEYFAPYTFKRNANLAEQGRPQYRCRRSGAGSSPGGPRTAFSVKLAGDHTRCVGAGCDPRLRNRVPADALPTEEASSACLHTGGRGVYAGRNTKYAGQASHLQHGGGPRGLLLSNVSGPKEGWQAETCDKPQKVKPVSEDRALQDGRHSHAERPAKSRRLDGQNRSERCIFHDSHCSGGPRVPQVSMEGQVVPVQLPTLRAVLSSVGLYQDHTASRGGSEGGRGTPDYIYRRHSCHGRDRVSITGPYISSGVPAGEPGVCDQPPQVTTHPISRDRVPGVHSQLLPDGAETPRGEDQKDKSRGRQSPASSLSVGRCPVPPHWENKCGSTGHPNGPTVLQEPPILPQRGSSGGPRLLLSGDPNTGGPRGTGMVEGPFHPVEWAEPDSSQLLPHHRD